MAIPYWDIRLYRGLCQSRLGEIGHDTATTSPSAFVLHLVVFIYRSRPFFSLQWADQGLKSFVCKVRDGREESAEHVTLHRYMANRHDTGLGHGPFQLMSTRAMISFPHHLKKK